MLWGTTKALLRPDLVVASVSAPLQTLTTRPIDVVAEIAEINGDTAATAHIALADAIGPLAGPIEVKVPAGGRASVTFPAVALTTAASTAAEGGRDGRRTRGVRRHERRAEHHRGGDEQRARPAAPARPEPRRLRLPVERAPLCPDHESRPGDAAGPGVEGEGARAAARPGLLQRQLGGERRRHARCRLGAEPRVVQERRQAGERLRCVDRDRLPDRRERQEGPDALDGADSPTSSRISSRCEA